MILTNIAAWNPKGITGNGRCKIGVCAGTLGNAPGDRRHLEQTVPNDRSRRPSQGAKTQGRREHKMEAVKNAVEADLVTEITQLVLK